MTIGGTAPNIRDLESMFRQCQAAIATIAFAAYLDPIKSAIDAVSKALRRGP